MRSQQLLKSARDNLAAADPADPTDHHVRQATIDAYRAVFHALAESNANCLYSHSLIDPDFTIHARAYRALNHSVWQIARSNEFRMRFSAPIRNFMATGGKLKPKRELADLYLAPYKILTAKRPAGRSRGPSRDQRIHCVISKRKAQACAFPSRKRAIDLHLYQSQPTKKFTAR